MANRLAHSTSPYLLQHAANPVDWQEWGQEAFAEARTRDVPVLLSVGYAACHWCHVTFRWGRNRAFRTGMCIRTGQRLTEPATECQMVHSCDDPSSPGDGPCLLALNADRRSVGE